MSRAMPVLFRFLSQRGIRYPHSGGPGRPAARLCLQFRVP